MENCIEVGLSCLLRAVLAQRRILPLACLNCGYRFSHLDGQGNLVNLLLNLRKPCNFRVYRP